MTWYDLINIIRQHHDYLVQFIGAFSGAFFALLFFLIGEWIKRKVEWKRTVNKEHAFLERYLGDLHQTIMYNKGLLPLIIEDYKNSTINIMNFTPVPIREDSTMKMRDTIFINEVENYITELKMLNRSLNILNKWKEGINEDLLHESERRRERGATIPVSYTHLTLPTIYSV